MPAGTIGDTSRADCSETSAPSPSLIQLRTARHSEQKDRRDCCSNGIDDVAPAMAPWHGLRELGCKSRFDGESSTEIAAQRQVHKHRHSSCPVRAPICHRVLPPAKRPFHPSNTRSPALHTLTKQHHPLLPLNPSHKTPPPNPLQRQPANPQQ